MKHLIKTNNLSGLEQADYGRVVFDTTDGNVYYKDASPSIEVVDLGLPSGTKWMKCNIGAENEYDYGKYFQWGDTIGYEGDEALAHSSWSTAPFNNGSTSYDLTYFASVSGTVCPNGVLANEYDAVYQATNGVAHLPTLEQMNELIENTNSEWTTINGINGRKYTNKNDSTKFIFIPSGGYAYDGNLKSQGSIGYVWSKSLYTDSISSQMLGSNVLSCGTSAARTSFKMVKQGNNIRGVLV